MLFEDCLLSSSMLSSKNSRAYSKKCAKKQVCLFVYFNKIIWLIIMKVKKKNRSHRYDINRHMSTHGLTYSKYKKCLSMIMLICIKQHPTNNWGSTYEKVKKYWSWVKKNLLLIKQFEACTAKNENPETPEINRNCSKAETTHCQNT